MDEWCGTTHYFIVDDYAWYGESVEEILESIIKPI